MYKTSTDRRFKKVKKEIRRAFIDLILEKGYANLTITEIADRADINRMTFYAHYDVIDDIFAEFVDDMKEQIVALVAKEETFDIDSFFMLLNSLMYDEIDFFRYVARENSMAAFRSSFKNTICELIQVEIEVDEETSEAEKTIISDMTAVCIAYAYLDWLAGEYGDVPLSTVIKIIKVNFINKELNFRRTKQ